MFSQLGLNIINSEFSIGLPPTVGGKDSKGLRAISYQGTRKVEAGYNPSQTTETLIGYTVCYQQCFFCPCFLNLQ
jgi:hypothetical protein